MAMNVSVSLSYLEKLQAEIMSLHKALDIEKKFSEEKDIIIVRLTEALKGHTSIVNNLQDALKQLTKL